jgi:hypothetical protein
VRKTEAVTGWRRKMRRRTKRSRKRRRIRKEV